MIVNYLIILIYLSFVLDFMVWPIPSEASTASLIDRRKQKNLLKRLFLIIVFIIGLVVYLTPLLLNIEIIITGSTLIPDVRGTIGLVVAIAGRIMTLAAVLILKNEREHGLVKRSLFRYSRHPISLGIHMTLLGLVIIFGQWYLWIGLLFSIVNIHLKIKVEEAALIQKYPKYRDYMRETPRYLIV